MNKFNTLSFLAAITLSLFFATSGNAQAVLYNDGGVLHVDKDAILYIEGDLNNKDTSLLENDGVIELDGDFTNDNTARLKNGTDNSSTERVYKFTGSGNQYIYGDVSDSNSRYF